MQARRVIYGFDLDSRIRQAANRMTARALFAAVAQVDDESPGFADELIQLFDEVESWGPHCLMGFDTGDFPSAEEQDDSPPPAAAPVEYYLKLIFRNEDAAYYQFHLASFGKLHANAKARSSTFAREGPSKPTAWARARQPGRRPSASRVMSLGVRVA